MEIIKLSILICLALCMATLCSSEPTETIFDPMDFEAYGDGVNDDSQALMDAFQAACDNNGPAAMVIKPGATYLSGPVTFEGPCYNKVSPKVRIMGTVKATPDLKDYSAPGWIEFRHLNKLEISGGGTLDGQGALAWKSTSCSKGSNGRRCNPTTLRLLTVLNAALSNFTIVNSKGFHIGIKGSSNVTVQHLNISAPEGSPNTDGIHISNSNTINLTSLVIGTGDDCVSIGPGSINVSMSKIVCGPGHGISIGSLGKYKNESDVIGIHVKDCTVKGTQNGVRIKSWPGSPAGRAMNISFENIVMENVSNAIIIDQQYCPDSQCTTHAPSNVKLSNIVFKKINGTTNEALAVNLICSPTYPCENVLLEDIDIRYFASDKNKNSTTITTTSISSQNITSSKSTSACTNVKGKASGVQHPISCI